MNYDIKNINLASGGKLRIDWAELEMPVLRLIRERFQKEKPLKGIKLGACLHVTAETANLMKTLKAGGAEVFLCASNPLSTQDDVAASLVKDEKIPVFAIKGEDSKTYFSHINSVLDTHPNITMDDGADLVAALHKSKIQIKNQKAEEWEFIGSSEETTTGVIRLKAMEKDGALKIPVVAVNDSDTKHLFDNRFGTGQSTIDGLVRATNILLAGKIFLVCGFGNCGKGLAERARGFGARVIIAEVDSVKALEATMMGYEVAKIDDAIKIADIAITVTGDKHVINEKHFFLAKDGIIIANSGHFNVEIDLEALDKMSVGKKRVREFVDEYEIKSQNSNVKSQNYSLNLKSKNVREYPLEIRVNQNETKQEKTKRIYVLGEGRLLNLTCAEGHPASVMDMSFANQALAAQWLLKNKNKLSPKVYRLPVEMDKEIAELKLQAMGISHDELSAEQKKYLESWKEGT